MSRLVTDATQPDVLDMTLTTLMRRQVGFPVYCRSSFGVYGAAWPVFNRALSACVWNGVNTVTGECANPTIHRATR